MEDLNYVFHEAMRFDPDSDEFVWHVLNAVAHGSEKGQRSPFWHASVTLVNAHRWRAMADARRAAASGSQPSGSGSGSQPSGSGSDHRVAVRIDIWAWFQSGTMKNHTLIDLSTDAAQHRTIFAAA